MLTAPLTAFRTDCRLSQRSDNLYQIRTERLLFSQFVDVIKSRLDIYYEKGLTNTLNTGEEDV